MRDSREFILLCALSQFRSLLEEEVVCTRLRVHDCVEVLLDMLVHIYSARDQCHLKYLISEHQRAHSENFGQQKTDPKSYPNPNDNKNWCHKRSVAKGMCMHSPAAVCKLNPKLGVSPCLFV